MAHSGTTLARFRCKINIVKLDNLEISNQARGGKIFLQYFVSIGSNQRIRIQTRDFDTNSCHRLMIGECSDLQCEGEYKKIVGFLQNCNILFEICRRSESKKKKKNTAVEVIGRAEVPWRELLVQSERFVKFEMAGGSRHTPAAAAVVRVEAAVVPSTRRMAEEVCGCMDCRWTGGCEALFDCGVATAAFVDGF